MEDITILQPPNPGPARSSPSKIGYRHQPLKLIVSVLILTLQVASMSLGVTLLQNTTVKANGHQQSVQVGAYAIASSSSKSIRGLYVVEWQSDGSAFFVKYDLNTRQPIWSLALVPNQPRAGDKFVISGNTAYITAVNSVQPPASVYAIDLEHGTFRWSKAIISRESPPTQPTVANGMVYVGQHDGKYHALNAATGKEEWIYDSGTATPGNYEPSPPVIVHDGIVYGTIGTKLFAVNGKTGRELWQKQFPGQELQAPFLVAGKLGLSSTLFSATGPIGYVSTFNLKTGKSIWQHQMAQPLTPDITVVGKTIYARNAVYGYDTPGDTIYAINGVTGHEQWHLFLKGASLTDLTATKEMVYAIVSPFIAQLNPLLYAIDPITHTIRWQKYDGSGYTIYDVVKGTVYISRNSPAGIATFNAKDGTPGWSQPFGTWTVPPLVTIITR